MWKFFRGNSPKEYTKITESATEIEKMHSRVAWEIQLKEKEKNALITRVVQTIEDKFQDVLCTLVKKKVDSDGWTIGSVMYIDWYDFCSPDDEQWNKTLKNTWDTAIRRVKYKELSRPFRACLGQNSGCWGKILIEFGTKT